MKRLLFVLPILAMIFVGCANPTTGSTEDPVVKTPAVTTSDNNDDEDTEVQETAAPDVSPYEYRLPDGVSYDDYTYVGNYVFSDLYDFVNTIWFNGTANSEYGYFMVLEKISRVRYSGSGTPYQVYNWDTDSSVLMNKGTLYKIYLKPAYIQAKKDAGQTKVFDSTGVTRDKIPDATIFRINANNTEYIQFTVSGSINVSDYSAY